MAKFFGYSDTDNIIPLEKDNKTSDLNFLIASILVECGFEDGDLSENEKERISKILEKNYRFQPKM